MKTIGNGIKKHPSDYVRRCWLTRSTITKNGFRPIPWAPLNRGVTRSQQSTAEEGKTQAAYTDANKCEKWHQKQQAEICEKS